MNLSKDISRLPPPVVDYLVTDAIANRSAAYFRLTANGHLLDWGGEPAAYGLKHLVKGQSIEKHLFFMDALLPLQKEAEQLFGLKFRRDRASEQSVDVHLFSSGAEDQREYWLLLLDVTQREDQQLRLQQKSNEFNLLRQHYAKLIHDAARAEPRSGALEPRQPDCAQSLTHSILVLKHLLPCTGSQQIRAPVDSGSAFRRLNASLSIIAQISGQEGGVIHHVFGEMVVVLFGLMPACQSPAQQAVNAAQRIISKCREFEAADSPEKIGVAVATDQGLADTIQSQGYRGFHALGSNVERALMLSSWIRAGVILIDQETFENLEKKEVFGPSLLVSKHEHLNGQTLYARDVS